MEHCLMSAFRRVMLECSRPRGYVGDMDQLSPSSVPHHPPELAPPGTPLHVAIAPGLRDQAHVIIRAEDDTDEDYEARSRLLAAILAFPDNT
jgi:hypothetical protein